MIKFNDIEFNTSVTINAAIETAPSQGKYIPVKTGAKTLSLSVVSANTEKFTACIGQRSTCTLIYNSVSEPLGEFYCVSISLQRASQGDAYTITLNLTEAIPKTGRVNDDLKVI